MLTSFGFYYLIGTFAFALFLTTPVFYSELKWDFKKKHPPLSWINSIPFLWMALHHRFPLWKRCRCYQNRMAHNPS